MKELLAGQRLEGTKEVGICLCLLAKRLQAGWIQDSRFKIQKELLESRVLDSRFKIFRGFS
jgi:hypothetical protein